VAERNVGGMNKINIKRERKQGGTMYKNNDKYREFHNVLQDYKNLL